MVLIKCDCHPKKCYHYTVLMFLKKKIKVKLRNRYKQAYCDIIVCHFFSESFKNTLTKALLTGKRNLFKTFTCIIVTGFGNLRTLVSEAIFFQHQKEILMFPFITETLSVLSGEQTVFSFKKTFCCRQLQYRETLQSYNKFLMT